MLGTGQTVNKIKPLLALILGGNWMEIIMSENNYGMKAGSADERWALRGPQGFLLLLGGWTLEHRCVHAGAWPCALHTPRGGGGGVLNSPAGLDEPGPERRGKESPGVSDSR